MHLQWHHIEGFHGLITQVTELSEGKAHWTVHVRVQNYACCFSGWLRCNSRTARYENIFIGKGISFAAPWPWICLVHSMIFYWECTLKRFSIWKQKLFAWTADWNSVHCLTPGLWTVTRHVVCVSVSVLCKAISQLILLFQRFVHAGLWQTGRVQVCSLGPSGGGSF